MARLLQLFVLVMVVVSVLAVAVPTRAQSAMDCQATIADLRVATEDATFFGQNAAKDRSGLLGKLDSVTTKLDQGKTADAVQSLTQFRDKVDALQTQGKIDPNDAQTLITGANEAIACVQTLKA